MTNIIKKNLPQKIMAFLCAISIWALAAIPRESELTEIQFFIPVSYVNLDKDYEITSQPVQSVNISVEVAQQEMKDIHPSLFQVVIDLKEARPGVNRYKITEKYIKAPAGVNVIKISPDQISLKLERIIEISLPVHAVLQGDPEKEYVLEKIDVEPKYLNVRGPVSVLGNLKEIKTKSIDINGINNDIERLVRVILPDRVSIQGDSEFHSVRIKVGSEPMNLRIDDIPIGIVNQTYLTRINPGKVNLLVRGPKSLLKNFTKHEVQAVIDLNGYKPGTYRVKPTLYLPPALKVQKVWPPVNIWILKQKVYE